jgi:hypothetical protein
MITTLSELDDKIVVFGQSCSGKTAFAQQLDHHYYCFDALFHWHSIETLGLSASANLQELSKICTADRYVLDGWHLSDKEGRYIPEGAVIYVVYASYEKIVEQYRVPLGSSEEVRPMFHKWYYEIEYPRLHCRYFANEGIFLETTEKEFQEFLNDEA